MLAGPADPKATAWKADSLAGQGQLLRRPARGPGCLERSAPRARGQQFCRALVALRLASGRVAPARQGADSPARSARAGASADGLGNLGPDLSLVGPGAAYVRGLASEGRAFPQEQVRPEPLAGGRI